jgi:hypothetical protein
LHEYAYNFDRISEEIVLVMLSMVDRLFKIARIMAQRRKKWQQRIDVKNVVGCLDLSQDLMALVTFFVQKDVCEKRKQQGGTIWVV